MCDCGIADSYHWGEDGWIYYASTSGIARVSASGGTPESVTTLAEGDTDHHRPELLPGGRALLFVGGPYFARRIAVHLLESGETRILTLGLDSRFAPSGHLIFTHDGAIWATPFDAERLELIGSPVPILPELSVGILNIDQAKFRFRRRWNVDLRRRKPRGTLAPVGRPKRQYDPGARGPSGIPVSTGLS